MTLVSHGRSVEVPTQNQCKSPKGCPRGLFVLVLCAFRGIPRGSPILRPGGKASMEAL